MIYNVNTDSQSQKPFQLVKFFSVTGIIVFFISTLVLSWVISNYAKRVMLQRSEDYALVISNNLNHQIITQFVVPIVLRGEKIALSKPSQHDRLDAIVRNAIHGMNVQSVTMFDSEENIISYSTDMDKIGRKDAGGKEYERALTGEDNSTIVATGSLLHLLPGAEQIFCELKTYIPFPFRPEIGEEEKKARVMGVIEIVQDLSGDLETIIQLQAMVISTSITIMAALFAVLWFIIVRADRIIEERAAERRKLEEKLNQAERLAGLGKMIASVSHEIKNPLGIVRSTAEILRKRLLSVAPGNEHLADIMIEETTRLDGIVREFLDFARPQIPQFKEVAINDLLRKAVKFMEPELQKHGIVLEMQHADAVPPVKIDPDLMYRVYLNVLINAVHAMPDGGALSVSSRQSTSGGRKFFLVSISDTGIGMTDEVKKQIFQPFFTDKSRGTGLGLAIAKNIVDHHHGVIEVESEKGLGTTFTIILPTDITK